MTDASKEPLELLGKFREDILRRQLSNTENYDKAVLSLGTTFLGFSMAFVKDFTPYHQAILGWLLPSSWGLFGLSIIATIASFFASQRGLAIQLEYAEQYYLRGDESVLTKTNPAAKWTNKLNAGSAISFVLAVVATIVFTATNLVTGGNMTEKKGNVTKGASIPNIQTTPGIAIEGAGIPGIQQVPNGVGIATGGAQIPTMQQVAKPPTSGGQSGSGSGNSGSGSK
ncbi:hypothetical protein MX652_12775 [Thauera aromatica]|nr:hypothetical protein [Thauera aromatica]MCK2127562.1 hypothetical protein [Thauera aromatica]